MDAKYWKVAAESYERTSISLREQSGHYRTRGEIFRADALLAASYTAGIMRAAAYDIFDAMTKDKVDG